MTDTKDSMPTYVSDVMCDFLGIKSDEECSRAHVTREINKYIKDNNLEHPDVMKMFYIDATLSKITNVEIGSTLFYVVIPKYIKHHFLFNDVYKRVS